MACFMSSSACRGARPKQVELKGKHMREHLISELMSQRSVLRFINAPDGFGKSTLVAQYADLVFAFKDVFWINCKSPCFIRDLDSQDIYKQILQITENPNLVVFDDVVTLNEDRQQKFSTLIDQLLEYNCEVIVNASLYNDEFVQYQPDALILNNDDLLLSQTEFIEIKNKFNIDDDDTIYKIPTMAWNKNGIEKLLNVAIDENFTEAILFSLFYIYLFQHGSLENLSSLISKSSYRMLLDFNEKYLYFGINQDAESFNVPKIVVKTLHNIFYSYKEIIYKYFQAEHRFDFAKKICGLLEDNDNIVRAIEVIINYGNKELKLECLKKWNALSISNMFMVEISNLYESIFINKNDSGLLTVFHAYRLAIFGLLKDAIRLSYSVLDNNNTTIDNKLFAALLFMRYGEVDEKSQAIKIIRYLNNDFKIENYLGNESIDVYDKNKCRAINKLSNIYLSIFSDSLNPFEHWLNIVDKNNILNEDILAAECIISSSVNIRPEFIRSEHCLNFFKKLSRTFNYGTKIEFNYYVFSLIKSYKKYRSSLEEYCGSLPWDVNNKLMEEYDKFDNDFFAHKSEFLSRYKPNFENFENVKLKDFDALNKLGLSYSSFISSGYIPTSDIPSLYISVFGGLNVYIGGKEIINTDFGRQNMKLICCILTLENGQEINKDKIASIIWPDSNIEQRRINMNTHWSILKRFFTLKNNVCPYLIRSQNSYKFNGHYLKSDVQKFDEVCGELTMGNIDSQYWLEIIKKNENLVSGDLLPSETDNAYINSKRTEYKNLMVNALVAASGRLLEAGEIQQALWFAQKAYSRESSREDVYVALMKAQMLAGQRTPAIETYLACKAYLENELGIKPSIQIDDLYKKVVSESLMF